MKKIIKIVLIMVFLFFVLSIFSNVKAASASISADKTNVKVGEKVTITVTMNAAAWNTKITGAQTKNFVGNSDSGENITKSEQVTFTPTSAGSFTINLSGDVSDGTTMQTTNVSGSVTIKASESTTGSSNSNNTKSEKPSEPTFKSANDTVYATGNINVRKSYSADSDLLGQLKTGDSVTRTGIGDNGWSKVTYNGSTGYIKTSLLTTEEPAKSSDKALKTLEITPEGLDPEFDPEVTSYTLIVGPDVEKLDIKAAPNDENAKVEITGNDSLQVGDNIVKITVTAQDETTRIYNINVKKQETVELGLSSLKINGYTLSPKFSTNVYEYKLNVLDPSVTNLDISAEANDENAKVEISGNTNLQNGENTIVITVTSQDGTEKVIYQIYVNKSNMAGTTNDTNNMVLYIGIGVVALIIIVTIIIIIKKRKRKNKNEKEDEFENLNDYSDLYGYSSRNSKAAENEELKSTGTEENTDKSKQDIENELFGKLPNDNNIQNNNEEPNKPTKNEDNFTYNPYVTKNIYGDYQKDMNTEIKSGSESTYNDLYGNINKSEDYSFRGNAQIDSTNNNITENNYDNNTSMIETPKTSEPEDYTLDDNYKIRKSKGKHSK